MKEKPLDPGYSYISTKKAIVIAMLKLKAHSQI